MSFPRKLIVLLALLCLLGAQQAAFAHWAAHLGAPVAAGLEAPDGEHAAAAVLGQSCTACAAFAGLDAALAGSALFAPDAFAHVEAAFPAPQGKSVCATRRYEARAPPVPL